MEQKNAPEQPRKKRATNKDVAKFAGVSVATVSYVINGKTDKRIPESTRKKVLQAANYLNYTPNPYAVGLNSPQPHSIVLRLPNQSDLLTDLEGLCFLKEFSNICRDNGFLLSCSADAAPSRITASACICMGMSKQEFHEFSEENFIPVLALDCRIDDPVFYQINADYEKMYNSLSAKIGRPFTFVAPLTQNTELQREICQTMPDTVFISSFAELLQQADSGTPLALSSPALIRFAREMQLQNIYFYTDYSEKRLPVLMQTIQKALDRVKVSDPEHYLKI